MGTLDWIVLGLYLCAMVGLSFYLSRGQEDEADYYVGGRNLPWWAVGISTMATQTSANSFIGIPAFVALTVGGGLTWLQYELAVPLAMIFVMVFLIPFFRDLKLISVYEYLEMRFDRRVRLVMSGVFLLSRGLGTGIGVYASGVVLSVCLDIPIWVCIILIGVVTIIYDTLGGMAAVVWSDVIQMFLLVGGLFLCVYLAVDAVGSWDAVMAAHLANDADRLNGVDWSWGFTKESNAPFWGFLVGGFFLYASYYGVDQSQAQRELSAPTTDDTKRSLVFNGLARFPLTVLYLVLGLAIGAVYFTSQELRDAIPAEHLDYLVPRFVVMHLPAGLKGLLFAAILAAAMSSLDSALNSLSAATMKDFIDPFMDTTGKVLKISKITTVCWGVGMTVFAFFVGNISSTVVEGINKIGSAFYGPILAGFLAGILFKRSTSLAVIFGIFAGVIFNCVLWVGYPDLYWMWWNLTGLVVTIVCTVGLSFAFPPPDPAKLERTTLMFEGILERERKWLLPYAGLVGYFVFILIIAIYSRDILEWLS
jgi:SSS family solute:Na+ symporter